MMLFNLKDCRDNLGLSQIKLASLSDVSLPTIQNIEAGKANPTIEVMRKLVRALGLEISIHPAPFDQVMAYNLGLPLLATIGQKKSTWPPSVELLKRELKKWGNLLLQEKFSLREELAVIAFVMALKDHYTDFYNREIAAPIFDKKIEQERSNGHVLKLRRMAIAAMSKYL